MRKLPIFLLLLFAISSFGFAPSTVNDAPADDVLCGTTLLSGCVGACGGSFKVSAEAPTSGFYCFDAVSSLCPTNGAMAGIEVNGTGIFLGDVSSGISFSFFASAGDKITIGAELFDKKSDVVCAWLGQVNITVKQP